MRWLGPVVSVGLKQVPRAIQFPDPVAERLNRFHPVTRDYSTLSRLRPGNGHIAGGDHGNVGHPVEYTLIIDVRVSESISDQEPQGRSRVVTEKLKGVPQPATCTALIDGNGKRIGLLTSEQAYYTRSSYTGVDRLAASLKLYGERRFTGDRQNRHQFGVTGHIRMSKFRACSRYPVLDCATMLVQ